MLEDLRETQQKAQQRGQDRWDNKLVPKWYEDNKAGQAETQKKISFGLRRSDEYGTENFKLPETNWQVLAGDSTGSVFKEKIVLYQEREEMMPWPGKKAWTGENLLQYSNKSLKLFDAEKGVSVPRSDVYADSEYGDFTSAVPDEAYKIISG